MMIWTNRLPFERVEEALFEIDFVEPVLDFDSADLGSDWPKAIITFNSKSKTVPDVEPFELDFDSFDLDSAQTF